MPSLLGYIDRRARKPMLRIRVNGKHFVALVDTGFNGELLMSANEAARLGVTMLHGQAHQVQTAGGVISVDRGNLTIDWCHGPRRTGVLVHSSVAGTQEVLLGTGLLHPGILTVEFLNDFVRIDP